MMILKYCISFSLLLPWLCIFSLRITGKCHRYIYFKQRICLDILKEAGKTNTELKVLLENRTENGNRDSDVIKNAVNGGNLT